jgi:putative transcriptional regulator
MSAKQGSADEARWAAAHERAKRSLAAMTDEEDAAITAAAESDPDCPPLTDAQLAQMRRMPLVKALRTGLGLSQAAFADRYGIPLRRVQAWEQGQRPDAVAAQYLEVIRVDAARVAKNVAKGRVMQAAE